MKDNKYEIRSYQTELRVNEEENSRTIRGLAIPVESRSELLFNEFYETIKSSAVNEDLIKNNDIRLFLNHSENQGTFARCKYGTGSLRLFITEKGLEFQTNLPKNFYGDYLLEGIRRGDFDGVSFAFKCNKDEWKKNSDGTYERSILSFGILTEISILSCKAAYPQTDVNIRSLEAYKEEEEKILQEEIRKNEIFSKLDTILNNIDTKYEKYLLK